MNSWYTLAKSAPYVEDAWAVGVVCRESTEGELTIARAMEEHEAISDLGTDSVDSI